MDTVFIGGISAVGKSYLADNVAKKTGAEHIDIDTFRSEMANDPLLKPWVNFFWDKDEKKYWKTVTCDKQWESITKQSEAFWPTIVANIERKKAAGRKIIFEGVNILPHLAAQNLYAGIYLLSDSVETIIARLKKEPRWSSDSTLQQKEAQEFFYCEQPRYKKEAEQYGFTCFTDMYEAEKELVKLLG